MVCENRSIRIRSPITRPVRAWTAGVEPEEQRNAENRAAQQDIAVSLEQFTT